MNSTKRSSFEKQSLQTIAPKADMLETFQEKRSSINSGTLELRKSHQIEKAMNIVENPYNKYKYYPYNKYKSTGLFITDQVENCPVKLKNALTKA
jgi:hypothetical protein